VAKLIKLLLKSYMPIEKAEALIIELVNEFFPGRHIHRNPPKRKWNE